MQNAENTPAHARTHPDRRELLERAGAFLAAVDRDDRGRALEVLRELGTRIAFVMLEAEWSMARAAHPCLAAHAAGHARFLRRFRELEDRYVGGLAPEQTRGAYDVVVALLEEHLLTIEAAREALARERLTKRAG